MGKKRGRTGWSRIHMCQIKIWRDILSVEVTLEERGVSAPHQASQPRVPVLGREVSITSFCKTSGD